MATRQLGTRLHTAARVALVAAVLFAVGLGSTSCGDPPAPSSAPEANASAAPAGPAARNPPPVRPPVAPVARADAPPPTPTRLPRSLDSIKRDKYPQVAWSDEEIDALIAEAVAAGTPPGTLYHPDERPLYLSRRFDLRPDTVLVDFGAGCGPLTMEILEDARPFGRIIAVDANEDSLAVLRDVLATSSSPDRERVEIVHNQPPETGLAPGTADVIVVNNVHLHMPPGSDDPWAAPAGELPPEVTATLDGLHDALGPDGRLWVIEIPPPGDGPLRASEMDLSAVTAPYTAVGFTLLSQEVIGPPGRADRRVMMSFSG